ncbi:hypothetical protein [Persephonella sp. IF05-L8]|uniref:hypothetical protein n=1 Tax=Persephonella sp. IF05-L8 TaxID=1158338 RepID=UPI000497F198
MRKNLLIIIGFVLFSYVGFAQEPQKPFILEHTFHKHRIDIVNSTVYQQIGEYGAIYNNSNLFTLFKFTSNDELFVNASITFGNGIIYKLERKGYSLFSTAADLEDYLEDINNTGRPYLLEFYYQRYLGKLIFAAGFIDATAYVDANKFANDENTQFLNDAFVNNPIAVLPSYNPGIYLSYKIFNTMGISGVYMQNKPDKGNVGIIEIEYETVSFSIRPYYYYLFGTYENKGAGVSADYSFTKNKGFFFRGGLSNYEYNYFVSGGFQIYSLFLDDQLGFGIGYIHKNNAEDITVSEAYYKINMSKMVSFTVDIQYMDENIRDFIYGGRLYFSY